MMFGEYQYQNHRDKARKDETEIDLNVSEHDEPSIPVSSFEFAGAFGASYTTGRILSTVSLSATVNYRA